MKSRSLALCAPIAMLAACGGGGSSPTPTPAATQPAPAPTPTPTPTPMPTTFDQLTGDQSFNTACSFFDIFAGLSPRPVNPITTTFPDGFTFDFQESSETWSVVGAFEFGEFNSSFGPDDITQNEPGNLIEYMRQTPVINANTNEPITETFTIETPQFDGGTADFVRFGGGALLATGDMSNSLVRCVFGIPTELDDPLPQEALVFGDNLDFDGQVFAVVTNGAPIPRQFDLGDSQITITVDPASSEISFALDLQGREVTEDADGNLTVLADDLTSLGTFSGTFVLTGDTQSFEGLIIQETAPTGEDFNAVPGQEIAGSFNGWFFGPQGSEIGMTFTGVGLGPLEENGLSFATSFTLAVAGPQDDD